MSSKIDCLLDIQESAHALLRRNYGRVYRSLIIVMKTTRNPSDWYIDERADPHLFYSLLAFANPSLFKMIYKKHDKCISLLQDGLKYIYNSPIELNDALDNLNDEDDPNLMDYSELYRQTRKDLAEDDATYIEEHKENLNNSNLLHKMERHEKWLNKEEDDIITQRIVFHKMIARYV